jgi:hypothetical protein
MIEYGFKKDKIIVLDPLLNSSKESKNNFGYKNCTVHCG